MRRILLATAAIAFAAAAQAQFPNKPIKFVVPLAVGGTGDTLSRAVAEEMSKQLGQPIVIDNKPGAGGLVGTEFVAAAPADGYTMLSVSPSHTINPALHVNKKTYDPLKDFETVTVMANTHQVIVAHPSVPFNDLKGLIEYAKKNPGKLNYGSAGTGSATHLNMALFLQMAGIDIAHIPYKGSTQARQDVLAGQVQLAMDGLLPLQPLIKDGRLKVLAVASTKRAASNPEIPTIGELVPGYASDTWYGIIIPAGVPKDVAAKLTNAAIKALNTPAIASRFATLGAEVVANSPEDFRKMLIEDQKKWTKVIKDTGAKATE